MASSSSPPLEDPSAQQPLMSAPFENSDSSTKSLKSLESATRDLRLLLENGIAQRFQLKKWCEDPTGGNCICGHDYWSSNHLTILHSLLLPVRPEAVKLIALEELQNRTDLDASALEYGEVDLSNLADVLRDVAKEAAKATEGDDDEAPAIFWDLGSGCGKVVFAAAATGAFTACFGVEILRDVAAIGDALLPEVRTYVAHKRCVDVRLFRGDALRGPTARWWPSAEVPPQDATVEGDEGGLLLVGEERDEGDSASASLPATQPPSPPARTSNASLVVYCDCTLFDEAGRIRLAHIAERHMPAGACVATALLPLPTRAFRVTAVRPVKFSWGEAEVVVQRRRAVNEPFGLCARCFDQMVLRSQDGGEQDHLEQEQVNTSDDPVGACHLCGWLWCHSRGCRVTCAVCEKNVCSDCSSTHGDGEKSVDICVQCAPPQDTMNDDDDDEEEE